MESSYIQHHAYVLAKMIKNNHQSTTIPFSFLAQDAPVECDDFQIAVFINWVKCNKNKVTKNQY
jgi:hypothetical protein